MAGEQHLVDVEKEYRNLSLYSNMMMMAIEADVDVWINRYNGLLPLTFLKSRIKLSTSPSSCRPYDVN